MNRANALRVLDEIAADQAGLVTAAQATARGIDRVTQLRLCQANLVESVGRGVYRVAGAAAPSHLDSRVVWLRLDPGRPAWERTGLGAKDGVISHRAACLLHELGDVPAPKVELTVPRRRTTREPGVRLHVGRLTPEDVTIVDGLPVTTVARTVVDLLRTHADGGHVGGVIADAEQRNLVNLDSLGERVGQFANRYGLSGASGDELLSALVEQGGRRLARDNVRESTKLAGLSGLFEGYRLAQPNIPALDALRALAAGPEFTETIRRLLEPMTGLRTPETGSILSPTLMQTLRKLSS
ncbi:MAG: type IV toxin-antitoxin system AbiEi family antitoxin domain-containing protein [Mycobacteriales bacterium]